MTRIAFIGAGSVVFTKNLLGDILDVPGAARRRDRAPRHRRRPARDRRGDGALRRRRARGESPTISAHLDRRVGDRRLRLRPQHGPDRRPRGDAARLRAPGALRPSPDDRRHARHRRHLPHAPHRRPHARARARDGRALSARRLAPQLHEPDGGALRARLPGHADDERRRALPLGPVHDRGSLPSSSACPRARSRSSRRASTTRHSSSASSTKARASIRGSTSGSPPTPSSSDASASRSTERLGYFPTESSEHAAEYVPWFMGHDDEIEHYRIPVDEYIRRSEANLVEFERVKAALARGERDRRSSARTSTRRVDRQLDRHRRAVA